MARHFIWQIFNCYLTQWIQIGERRAMGPTYVKLDSFNPFQGSVREIQTHSFHRHIAMATAPSIGIIPTVIIKRRA